MRAAPVLLFVLLLSACGDSSSRASHDWTACRRSADSSMGADAAIDPADEHTANPMVMFQREERRDQYQTLVDQCMGTNH